MTSQHAGNRGFALQQIVIMVGIIALAGVYLYFDRAKTGIGPQACTMEAKLCPDGSAVGRTGPNCEFAPCPGGDTSVNTAPGGAVRTYGTTLSSMQLSWQVRELDPIGEFGPPTSEVVVEADRQKYTIGIYNGSCHPKEGGVEWEQVAPGILCWFAGGGTELGIFGENGAFAVKERIVEEGTAEEAGYTGGWITVITIERSPASGNEL